MNKKVYFKTALDYPNRASALLFVQLEKQKHIRKLVCEALPSSIAQHVHECIIKDNKLILYTDSATWASQLRFYQPLIHNIIRSKIAASIEAIQVKIYIPPEPKIHLTDKRKAHKNFPSEKTLDGMQKNTQAITDEHLKDALVRLEKVLRSKR